MTVPVPALAPQGAAGDPGVRDAFEALDPFAANSAAGAESHPDHPSASPLAEAFRDAYRRALAQRSDAPGTAAASAAAAYAARAQLVERWAATQAEDARRVGDDGQGPKRVHYLSMEFLMGRAMRDALAALGLDKDWPRLLGPEAPALAALVAAEPDAALGNGGLGRLAACFLDAFATLGLPSFGYGLRYEHGMFAQAIQDGCQVELPDDWLRQGNPWELVRPELRYRVGFGGTVGDLTGGAANGSAAGPGGPRHWQPAELLVAQAYDFIVPGHGTPRVSTLRQWNAQPAHSIDFAAFCRGEHAAAARHLLEAERLNWVLYPDDSTPAGRELRLRQEYFLVSASVQDMLARHLRESAAQPALGGVAGFGRFNALHLNDTHPALAPVELMRLLLDEQGLAWDAAWAITHQATSYTNHTLMPEALETWSLPLFARMLPRHLEIVYEINARHLTEVRAHFPGDEARVARMSLIDEHGERRVRMGALAVVASHTVNGVSALHSALMVRSLFADAAALWPQRFTNVTNGVTPRRWLAQANPGLSALVDRRIGRGWRGDLAQLARLGEQADDPALGQAFLASKAANKAALARLVQQTLGLRVDPHSLFDVQIKRIHEYKRQLLNLLHVVARWQAMVADPGAPWPSRTVLFAGKAASAYVAAKRVIRLIHDVARVVNNDPRLDGRLKLVFLPNYGVSLAEQIIPAADLSEQISTAGTEASGTGNMKFALNGACTIGTWDGANIEMAEAMGPAQMFVFGLRAEQVAGLKAAGYRPQTFIDPNPVLQQVLQAIGEGRFSPDEPGRYAGLVQQLRTHDPYLLMADFDAYWQAQQAVDVLWAQPTAWAARALRNVAGMGFFSVDRCIAEYRDRIWSPPG